MNLSKLRAKIETYFNLDEIVDLCYVLSIEYENLTGNTRTAKARELTDYCFRHGKLSLLVRTCENLRPHVEWQQDNSPQINTKVTRQAIRQSLPDHIADFVVPDPLGMDVMNFEVAVDFVKNANHFNSTNWSRLKGNKGYESIEGFWSSRWFNDSSQSIKWYEGTSHLISSNSWILIYHEDSTSQYVIKAKQFGSKLIGRYVNMKIKTDTSPWIGLVVSNRRIDGKWLEGDWDFRR